jgi:hypothetical protein
MLVVDCRESGCWTGERFSFGVRERERIIFYAGVTFRKKRLAINHQLEEGKHLRFFWLLVATGVSYGLDQK